MKRLFCLLLVLLLVPFSVLSDEYLPLSDFEKNFVGGWAMYASRPDGTVYHYTLTFTEDRTVFFRTLIIKDGKAETYNTVSSGEWLEFVSDTVILSLSGKTFISSIKEDDVLKLIQYDGMIASGYFTRCPDMGYTFGD